MLLGVLTIDTFSSNAKFGMTNLDDDAGVIYLDGGWEAASLFFARHIQLPEKLEDLL